MLHRKQLNVFRLRLLPLFFVSVFVLSVMVSPQIHGITNIKFKSLCDASANTVNTISCTLSGVSTSDTIISNIYGVGVFNSFTTTDGQSNSYTQKVSSITGSGSGISTYIQATLATASSGSLVVTVATGGPNRIYEIVISDYSGVIGFNNFANDQQDSAGNSGSSSISLSTSSGSSVMIDDFGIAGSSFTITQSNGQTIRDSVTNNAFVPCNNNGCKAADSQSPTLGWSWSGGVNCTPCFVSHSVLEMTGNPQSSTNFTVSQCYGNCGNPPITLVNTNSTSSINFNLSITLFYEFQSGLNGVINNVTVSNGQRCFSGQKCVSNTEYLAVYSAGICPINTTPFTSTCVGSRLAQASTSPPGPNTPANSCPGSDGSPNCQRTVLICPSNCVVSNGQWIAIAISFQFSGWAINDTNINVQLFQTNGITPTTISSSSTASSLCSGCKMGLWAWITGNTPTTVTPPTFSGNCGNGIGDYLTCLTLTFCTGTPNVGCQLAGGLFWSMIYSIVGIVGLMWIDHKFLGVESGVHVPATGYAFIPLGVQFMFISLGILPLWWGILLIMAITIMFTSILLGIVKSRQA